MKTTKVLVPWQEGLHARPAARLVRRIRHLHSRILLRTGQRVADGRSILSVLMLCATLNTAIDIEASGEDEETAIRVVESLFVDPTVSDWDQSDGDLALEFGADGSLGAHPLPESKATGTT